jgi:hypothetical protein
VKAGDVRRDLRRRAEALGLDFQQALQYYAIERFLFRLSQTALADKLIVKGAIMLRVWGGAITRPTRDIDLLKSFGLPLRSVLQLTLKTVWHSRRPWPLNR